MLPILKIRKNKIFGLKYQKKSKNLSHLIIFKILNPKNNNEFSLNQSDHITRVHR